MTALDRIRRRIGPADGTTPRAFVELETVRAMLELVGAVRAYVDNRACDDDLSRELVDMRQALKELEALP